MRASLARPPKPIAVEACGLMLAEFERKYRSKNRPVVIRNATQSSSKRFRELTRISSLLQAYGNASITVSSANSFSYGRRRLRLREYLGSIKKDGWKTSQPADELYYWFGEHGDELKPLLEEYNLPVFLSSQTLVAGVGPASETSIRVDNVALSFGVAAHSSGVPFHVHNDGFAEVMHGAKRWLFYDQRPPHFDPNVTSYAWLQDVYPNLNDDNAPEEVIIYPGDLLYFPKGVWHSTVNIGTSVFISAFLA